MSTMKKVVITEFGDESKLAIVHGDLPAPSRGEVQLTVEYSVVAGSDVNMRNGTYPLQRKAPLTPGYSVIGTVRLNGEGCARFKMGDRVACLSKYDGQAELINLPALTKTAKRSAGPMMLKLFSRKLFFWSSKRTTFFSLTRKSKNFTPDLERLFEWLKAGKLTVPIKATFSLDEIQQAHREYASSPRLGSIVIRIRP